MEPKEVENSVTKLHLKSVTQKRRRGLISVIKQYNNCILLQTIKICFALI